jgi:hypothetical protein
MNGGHFIVGSPLLFTADLHVTRMLLYAMAFSCFEALLLHKYACQSVL